MRTWDAFIKFGNTTTIQVIEARDRKIALRRARKEAAMFGGKMIKLLVFKPDEEKR